jgi:hypothetical protein
MFKKGKKMFLKFKKMVQYGPKALKKNLPQKPPKASKKPSKASKSPPKPPNPSKSL